MLIHSVTWQHFKDCQLPQKPTCDFAFLCTNLRQQGSNTLHQADNYVTSAFAGHRLLSKLLPPWPRWLLIASTPQCLQKSASSTKMRPDAASWCNISDVERLRYDTLSSVPSSQGRFCNVLFPSGASWPVCLDSWWGWQWRGPSP